MPGILRMVRTKLRVVVCADIRGWNITRFLTQIGRTAHTDESPFDEIVRRLIVQGYRIDQHGQIVGVAAHHLNEAILTGLKCCIVDAMGIHLSEAELTPLGDKASGIGQMPIPICFVLQTESLGCAIDDNTRLF